MSLLTHWDNFYVIVGSSSGALLGLTFIVITLVAGRQIQDGGWGVGAFTTPTVVHFGMVLFICALLTAPWPSLEAAAVLLGLTGLAGVGYSAIVARRMGRRLGYEPEWEDWLWFVIVPLVAYTALVITAILLQASTEPVLFVTGAVTLLLLFMSIHNAWDLVTYLAIPHAEHSTEAKGEEGEAKGEEGEAKGEEGEANE